MIDHIVTAHGGSVSDPYIVATDANKRARLVKLALHDPDYRGIAARDHHTAVFYLADRPIGVVHGGRPRRMLQIGHFAKFGGALFYDDPRPPGDTSVIDRDWAWLALRPRPLADVPAVYFDQDSGTLFPPRCIMPIDELHGIVMEFVNTGDRPTPWNG